MARLRSVVSDESAASGAGGTMQARNYDGVVVIRVVREDGGVRGPVQEDAWGGEAAAVGRRGSGREGLSVGAGAAVRWRRPLVGVVAVAEAKIGIGKEAGH